MTAPPLTLGTAGHIDHGKTALVEALTGVHTDRLPEEQARGMSIALGYAPLVLRSGRRLSVVDVPGHERFVRTMVSGATGIDLFLLVVAADDGVMPQTREHLTVLRALGVDAGVVAVTKADVADPARAAAEAAELVPGAAIVACSARTGDGVEELRAALERAAAAIAPRPARDGEPPVLHTDRAFTLPGAGVVVTGTLRSGTVGRGDALVLSPAGMRVRVRGVHVHDEAVERAGAGQRVAVALTGVRRGDVGPGDVLAAPGAVEERSVLDCALRLHDAEHGRRVTVHHGTRAVPARLVALAGDLWQLRLERPLAARDGDRVVVRRPTPADTLGGGVVLDAAARRHGARPELLERLRRRRDGVPEPAVPEAPPPAPEAAEPAPLDAAALAVEERLRAAGPELLRPAGDADQAALVALRAAGRAVRLRGDHYAHPEALAAVRDQVVAAIERDGDVTLAGLRDALGIARRQAQALLEHLDAERVTRRLGDDRRVLSHRLAREREGAPR